MLFEGVSSSRLHFAVAVGVETLISVRMLVVTLSGVGRTFGKRHLNGVLTGLDIGLTGFELGYLLY